MIRPPCRCVASRIALITSTLTLGACSSVAMQPSSGPVAATIAVVERGWHTDVCISHQDADSLGAVLAPEFGPFRYLCFGFGERQYVVARKHDPLTEIAALFPSPAALLMTVLSAPPEAAFGRDNVVELGITRNGLSGLQAFLRRSISNDAAGRPIKLGTGPYLGSVFFAAADTYDAFHTCNSWTADALRSAGLPLAGAYLLSGNLMSEVRRISIDVSKQSQ
jgi:uncharacterized protein (TIGR02117 family)